MSNPVLSLPVSIQTALTALRTQAVTLTTDDKLRLRRALEDAVIEHGKVADQVLSKVPIEAVKFDSGELSVTVSAGALLVPAFQATILRQASADWRAELDARLYASLGADSSASKTTTAETSFSLGVDKNEVFTWLNEVATASAPADLRQVKMAIAMVLTADGTTATTGSPRGLARKLAVEGGVLKLTLEPAAGKLVECVRILLPTLSPKQIATLDARLTQSLVANAGKSMSAGDAAPSTTAPRSTTSRKS